VSTLLAAFLGAMAGTTLFTWLAAWYLHRLFRKDRDIEKVEITVIRRDL
jgi:cytochrome oxidase assembly protein ShyY1